MPDRVGNELQPGDRVLVSDPNDDEGPAVGGGRASAPATVLRVIGDNRYVVQVDPDGPLEDLSPGAHPALVSLVDQEQALMDDMRSKGLDPQDSFEVDGERLEALETEDDIDP